MLVQKAKHLYAELDKKKPACEGQTYAIFEKYDGWFGYIDIRPTEEVVIKSRAGREIPSLADLSKSLRGSLPAAFSGRLIFEITIPSITDFSTLNGVLNRSKAPCQAAGVVLKCHDLIVDESEGFGDRYVRLTDLVSYINRNDVQLAKIHGYGSHTDVQAFAEKVWAKGGEGAIGKQLNAPYRAGKRDATLIKVKEDVDADLLVIGVLGGQGKYQGTLGTLVCRDKAGNKHRVSGMTDAQRDQWWNSIDEIVGKVIEIKAMKKLPDGQYREPRFKAVRFDKTVADID